MHIKLFIVGFLLFTNSVVYPQMDMLRNKIENVIKDKRAIIGVAISSENGQDTLSVNGTERFPMQSVYKYHLALSVLDLVEKDKIQLNDKIVIRKEDLLPYYSPLREKYPEGNVELTIDELIRYAVSKSDNVACDLLFRLVGGPTVVNDFIHSQEINDISIVATEEGMHSSWDVQYRNWSTPRAAAELLCKFRNKKILTSTYEYLWKVMIETSTGPKRLKGLLPVGTEVAHKTGTGPENKEGMTSATNDIGIIVLPNGKNYSIAVFVSDSFETMETNEEIISKISKAAYDYFTNK
ncbi:MAG: class A beta-lactamase, subclass A2 [Candidatus Kapaibacterium sp.]